MIIKKVWLHTDAATAKQHFGHGEDRAQRRRRRTRDTLTGLSLMVGLETQRYSLPSSMQASIRAWTELSSWKSRNAYPGRRDAVGVMSRPDGIEEKTGLPGTPASQLTFRGEIRLALGLVGPVHKQVTEPTEAGGDFIWKEMKRGDQCADS